MFDLLEEEGVKRYLSPSFTEIIEIKAFCTCGRFGIYVDLGNFSP